jgi:hypothetical protein
MKIERHQESHQSCRDYLIVPYAYKHTPQQMLSQTEIIKGDNECLRGP